VREALEPLAARLAAEGTMASRSQVMTAYRIMETSVDSLPKFVEKDTQFHRAILHASGNIFLMANGNLIFSVLERQINLINRTAEVNTGCLPLHLAVAEAILAGEPAKAEKKMLALLKDAREETYKSFEEHK
ncbi:MAG: FadR family transcriptional regulator, partial [Betaproteobacteria bacterium AqS2]|nr:FadR family transcriptional regulator [Betaproteobacteria bacterium AqS2]